MHKYQNIDKETLKRYIGNDLFKSVSELETARKNYFQSEYYLKNRRRCRFIPPDNIPSLKLFRNLDEIEMATIIVVDELQKEAGGIMPKNILIRLQGKLIDEIKVFPPPIDVYVSHTVASKIFGVSTEKLKLHRETGLLPFIKIKGVFNYHWPQLQEQFG